jgi:hypothetical protein
MPRRKKRKRPNDRRGKNPNSLKNLRPPIKPGEVLNPLGINAKTPMTDEYRVTAADSIPELIRRKLNDALGEEILKPGATWAKANALRRFIHAVMEEGGVRSSTEIREAIEGIAPHRIEIAAGGPVSATKWPTLVFVPVKSRFSEQPSPGFKMLEAEKVPPVATNGNSNDSES